MAPRVRILAFGAAAATVVAGAISAALISGLAGEVLAIVLISAGLGAALLLLFLEVGLSEDRERARDQRRRSPGSPPPHHLRRRPIHRWPRRPGGPTDH